MRPLALHAIKAKLYYNDWEKWLEAYLRVQWLFLPLLHRGKVNHLTSLILRDSVNQADVMEMMIGFRRGSNSTTFSKTHNCTGGLPGSLASPVDSPTNLFPPRLLPYHQMWLTSSPCQPSGCGCVQLSTAAEVAQFALALLQVPGTIS